MPSRRRATVAPTSASSREAAGTSSRAGPLVPRDDDGVDAAADGEVALDGHLERLGRGDEIVEDPVRDVLVEGALVAVAPEVELERLQLDAELIRHVADADRRKVRLPRLRAEARELGAFEADLVAPPRRRIGTRV